MKIQSDKCSREISFNESQIVVVRDYRNSNNNVWVKTIIDEIGCNGIDFVKTV